MPPDIRTTPRALRLPVLLALAVLAVYFVDCWKNALGDGAPSLLRFFATWQMFTLRDPSHAEVFGEAMVDGAWQPVDLEALFPTRWESGPRYARSSFYSSIGRMRVLAAATCKRLPTPPTRVRFRVERWPKTLGSVAQPKRNMKAQEIVDWECDRAVSLPNGRLL
jgi:hypothetical protein